jgi:hypothetical protein
MLPIQAPISMANPSTSRKARITPRRSCEYCLVLDERRRTESLGFITRLTHLCKADSGHGNQDILHSLDDVHTCLFIAALAKGP